MRTKRFSGLHLLLAVVITLALALGGGFLVLRAAVGDGGLSLLRGLALVNTRFVGEYEEDAVVDAALEGMVSGLGDRWSYYLTAQEYRDQEERRKNQYVGIGVTVDYTREEGLNILEITPGSPAEEAGLKPGEVIVAAGGESLAGEARYSGAHQGRGGQRRHPGGAGGGREHPRGGGAAPHRADRPRDQRAAGGRHRLREGVQLL